MSAITLNKIILPAPADAVGTVMVEYKLSTQPASSYVLFDASISIDVDGNITESPLPIITGLTSGLLYNVRVTQNCGSPAPYWIENITAE